MEDPMKSESWIVLELGAALLGLAVLSFFRVPSYEKAAWFIIGAFSTAFGTVMGYKFGKSMPQQANDPKAGATTVTDTHVASTVPAAPVVPPVK
jgi:hypothetical protein